MLFRSFSALLLPLIAVVYAGYSGQATYFEVGLGACGWVNVPTDFIVALNHEQFDVGSGYPGPECGRGLTIYHNGKSTHATVSDRCPSCAFGDLDLSSGLFSYLEALSVGRFSMTWSWDGESPSSTPSPTAEHISSPRARTSTPGSQSSTFQNTTAASFTVAGIPYSQTNSPPAATGTTPTPLHSTLLLANNAVLNLANMINLAAMHSA